MNVNGITAAEEYVNNTRSVREKESAAKKKVATETDNKAVKEEKAAVYEASNKKPTKADNKKIVSQMKADLQSRTDQLQNIVTQLMGQQGTAYGKANDMWKFLAGGNFTVDATTKTQAQNDISENGYWGVNATSDRILDFAKALCGDDTDKIEKLKNAFIKGYQQAEKTWGGKLPDICKQTYDSVINKFDEWAKGTTATEDTSVEE